ncbi:hypothetical protein [Actinoplanes sp. NPDC051851]|uniref:hypothetical protein n=1 Tax=Actinoplanes sp. NPDC051851 TaxID=3154753 RepID=UPI00342CE18F
MGSHPTAETVATLRLPGKGWLLQWRSDGFWRDLGDDQYRDERDGVHQPTENEWGRWTGVAPPTARGTGWDTGTGWWLLHGERPDTDLPYVELADGTRPPVAVLEGVWACEWHGIARPATVHVGREQFHIPFATPLRRWLEY